MSSGDGGDGAPKKKRGRAAKTLVPLAGVAVWTAGMIANRVVNKIINRHNERRVEAKNQKLAREWAKAMDVRFTSLAMEDGKSKDAKDDALSGWSGPQSSAWRELSPRKYRALSLLANRDRPSATRPQPGDSPRKMEETQLDVLMQSLWKEVISEVIESLAPSLVNELLSVYLDARDVVPIPDFITNMELASLEIGDRCPFSIRSVRVAHAPTAPADKQPGTPAASASPAGPAGPAHGHSFRKQNSKGAAADKDPSPPDPEDLILDLDVECLSARLEVIIRSHMRLPLEGHLGELLNKFRRDKRGNATLDVHITEMRFEGVVRVRIRPRARIVMIGLQEAPKIQLGMQGVFKSKLGFEQTVPMTALPGVVDLFQLLAKAEIEEYATWPRFLAVDMCPPLLLNVHTFPSPPRGRLVVTLLEARGIPATSAPASAQPFARYRWGLIYRKRGGQSAGPVKYDDAGQNGHASWGEGDTIEGTMLLSIEMITVTLCLPGAGAIGSCQVKLFRMGTGETVFYFNSGSEDSFTALPTFLVAEDTDKLGPHWGSKLPGRLQQADWPIDREGAAEMEKPPPQPNRDELSLAAAAKAAEVQRAHEEVTEVLTIVEARGVDPTKRWRCVVRNHGQHQAAWQKTQVQRGEVDAERGMVTSGPRWNQAFELRHSIEPATIVLVRVGTPLQAKKEVEVAYAHVPRLGLGTGKCSAFWVDLKVLEGKDAAAALGLAAGGGGGGGWGDDGEEDSGTPRGGGDVEAKVEGIKNAFAQASAGLKKAFGGGGRRPGEEESRSSQSGHHPREDFSQPKLLLRVGFAPKRQLEDVASEAQLAPLGAEAD